MSVMKNLSSQFAAQFAAASLSSLVDSFNGKVGLRAWSSARAAHDQALMAELVARGIDVSAVDDGHSTSFAHKVRLDESSMKLVIAEYPQHLHNNRPSVCLLLHWRTFAFNRTRSTHRVHAMMGSALCHIAYTLSVAWNGYASLYTFPKVSKGAKWFLSLQSRDGLGQYSHIILLLARACANISNDVK